MKALDKEMLKSISEIYFNFAQNGQLTQIKSKMPIGTQILTPSYKSLPATKNRWLGHKYVKKSFFGHRTMVSETSIKHQKIDGFVLPQEITIQTTLENIDNQDKNQRVQKNAQVIRLTDFKVNADVAKGHFSKRKKMKGINLHKCLSTLLLLGAMFLISCNQKLDKPKVRKDVVAVDGCRHSKFFGTVLDKENLKNLFVCLGWEKNSLIFIKN